MNLSQSAVRKRGFLLTTLELPVAGLAPDLDGYRIVQLSDLHFGMTRAGLIRRAVTLANSIEPDLIVLTGDYLEYTAWALRTMLLPELGLSIASARRYRPSIVKLAAALGETLSALQAKDGIVAILGNHEYLEGVRRIRRNLPQHIRWLVNSTTELTRGNAKILIAGLDDLKRGSPDIRRTLNGSAHASTGGTFNLFLSHNPDFVLLPAADLAQDFHLALCGHTHGGQICLPLFGPIVTQTAQRRHIRGLAHEGKLPVYVSRGIGYQGVPIRLWCPPEIVTIVLRKH